MLPRAYSCFVTGHNGTNHECIIQCAEIETGQNNMSWSVGSRPRNGAKYFLEERGVENWETREDRQAQCRNGR